MINTKRYNSSKKKVQAFALVQILPLLLNSCVTLANLKSLGIFFFFFVPESVFGWNQHIQQDREPSEIKPERLRGWNLILGWGQFCDPSGDVEERG